jgi:hypothetical protein
LSGKIFFTSSLEPFEIPVNWKFKEASASFFWLMGNRRIKFGIAFAKYTQTSSNAVQKWEKRKRY